MIKDMVGPAKMTDDEFRKLSTFIYSGYGIKMPPAKKTMLESRLQKRLNALNITSFKTYCDYLFSSEGQKSEIIHMMDVVTTNKTDFFREPFHFDYLMSNCFPEMVKNNDVTRPLRIWSAGCSSGEEPYTIAMVANEYSEKHMLYYSILGTDLSSEILNKANIAVYNEERINGIPDSIKTKYFLKSKNKELKTVRLVPEIRRKVSFSRLNFMDNTYNLPYKFDIIFCRNVLIYFDKKTQEDVINKLCSHLNKGGIFFLGHSESITDMQVPLSQIRPTIFRRI